MEYRIWGVRFGFFFSSCVLVFLLIKSAIIMVTPAVRYHWDFGDQLSEMAQQSIIDTFSNQTNSSLHKLVKNFFPYLACLNARHLVSGAVQMSCIEHDPCIFLSMSQVITRAGTICNRDYFAEQALCGLPTIWTKNNIGQAEVSELQSLIRWALQVPQSVLKEWNVTWQDPHTIWLQDRVDQAFVIRTSVDVVLTSVLLQMCFELKKDLIKRRSLSKHTGDWVVDVRFEGQLIISPEPHHFFVDSISHKELIKEKETGRGEYGPNIV